jgi:hypothetical protein
VDGPDAAGKLSVCVKHETLDVRDPRHTTTLVRTTRCTVRPDAPLEAFEQFLRTELVGFEIHEVDEWLKHDGKCITDPHPKGKQLRRVDLQGVFV